MYIVVSYKNFDGYYREFETYDEAEEFLNTEENDFRTRVLYDFTDGTPDDFKNDWCYRGEEEELANRDGFFWDESLELFTILRRKEI